jgi:N-acetyl-anhydromuramyl-L-alanine amidase AmpD
LEPEGALRYPPAIWRPTDKHGYGHDDTHLHEGICAHSMEGSLAAAFGELDNPNREASWTFSVAKNGDVYQHVDTDNISWANGSKKANKKFWGIEHEGVAGEPLTLSQEFATTCLMEWLLDTYGLQPVRHQVLWEHNEMTAYGASPTACPSGRIPWDTIIPDLEEDSNMTPEHEAEHKLLREQVNTLITQVISLIAFEGNQQNINKVCEIVRGQVDGLLAAEKTGAHHH